MAGLPSQKKNPEEQLADFLASCYDDPLKYVMGAFPWDTEKSIQMIKLTGKYKKRFNCEYGPDKWQCEFLDDLGREIRQRGFDGKTAVNPIQFATVSGHGIGKTSIVAWLIKFILDTRPFSRGVVTATTAEQLKTKTWAEVGKWHRLSLTQHWFRYNAGRGTMMLTHHEYPQEWRCDAHTCREENSEAFQGLHAANSTPFYIFDEGSGIPDKIFEAREGGSTDGEPMLFDFGNPTRNSGRFFEECEGKFKHRWRVRRIDSRDVTITNKKRIRQWYDDYGEDSDFFKVRVRGVFPATGDRQFISRDIVDVAQSRPLVEDRYAPLVLGVDVARFGKNESVIYPRKGRDARTFPPRRYLGLDTIQLCGRIIEAYREFTSLGIKPAAIFIDGQGIGGAVVDQLRHLGYEPTEVHFSGKPMDGMTYRYKIDELYGDLRDDIKSGLCLPSYHTQEGFDLAQQLTQREYYYTLKGQTSLESKDDMEERGIASPDVADALALTYALEVAPTETVAGGAAVHTLNTWKDYDPLEKFKL